MSRTARADPYPVFLAPVVIQLVEVGLRGHPELQKKREPSRDREKEAAALLLVNQRGHEAAGIGKNKAFSPGEKKAPKAGLCFFAQPAFFSGTLPEKTVRSRQRQAGVSSGMR